MSARPIRVLHVIDSLGAGGAERSLAELLPALAGLGVESTVAVLRRREEGVHALVEDGGTRVVEVGHRRLRAVRRLRRLIAAERPDIVHTTLFEAGLTGRLAALGAPCRVVTSVVSTAYDHPAPTRAWPTLLKRHLVKAVDGLLSRRATDLLHAITMTARRSASVHLGVPAERIVVVPRGRDLARLGAPGRARREAVRQALGLRPDDVVVLNVGRQEPPKGHRILLAAAAILLQGHPRVVLLQAGRAGACTASIEEDAAPLGDAVRLLGHRDDVGDLLCAADLFVFPSLHEGLGGSVLEAMALGVPTVVSDAPALVEVVDGGRAALVVPAGDAPALAAGLDRLLTDPELARRLGQAARARFAERFTLEGSAVAMHELYLGVLGREHDRRDVPA